MKNFILSLALLSIGFWGYAQEQPDFEEKIRQYSRKIDSIVSAEKNMMIKEIDSLERLNYEQEWFFKEKRNIAQKYEQRINRKVSIERQLLDELTKERVKTSVMQAQEQEKGLPTIHIGNGKIRYGKKEKDYTPEGYGLSVSYGFLNLTNSNVSFDPFENYSQMRIGNSHSFELQMRRVKQLGNKTIPFLIAYGLAWRSDTYMPKRPLVFDISTQEIGLNEFMLGKLKRSKFRNNYLTFPVDFQWVLNPQYTDVNSVKTLDLRKSGQWRLGVGLYTGIKLRSLSKVKYYDHNGKFDKYQTKADSGVTPFLFGGKFSLSYNSLTLFLKKDFTPVFDNQAQIPSKYGIQIGLEIINLGF